MKRGGIEGGMEVYKSINIMKKKAEPAQQSNKLSIIFLTKLISSHQVDGCGRRLRKEANRLKLNEWQEMVGSISRPG